MRGLSMSAARYALLRLEESQPHVKNWRPQILILVNTVTQESNVKIKHPKLIALASQLKAGKGLTVSANVIAGDYIEKLQLAKTSKHILKDAMSEYKVKGFCDTLVAQNVEQGLCHLLQTEGLGGLRHNTVIMNWPSTSDKDDEKLLNYHGFVNTLRFANADESAIILTKNIDNWPIDKKLECQNETIDIWWIIHDGGLLLLIVFLLKKHKIWQKCKLRLFTVAQMQENSVQMKNDLIQYMYYLRIEAEVDVIEMPDSEISAYTYEKTLKLEEREKLLKDFKLKSHVINDSEPQSIIDRVRRSSLLKTSIQTTTASSTIKMSNLTGAGETTMPLLSENTENETLNGLCNGANIHEEYEAKLIKVSSGNHLTVGGATPLTSSSTASSSPSKLKGNFKSETMRKMHTAIELNKKIIEKSKNASLVLLNIPAPPKTPTAINDFSYMEYVNVLTEGLNRTLLVRGSGREVITIFS